ncbi:hypothetical protein S101447_01815 [Acetobacter ascendens]|uniref:Uncharacterized protein n=1 Tax=Acetobacter ascendens TaxID=481146 RepID=A0A1Y0V7W3_9PROT|nr:hypothetical protein S101447_01815 [Acetobacter ascendens]
MTPDCGVAPQLALGAGDALIVEGFGNGAWPNAGGEVTEDATDDLRLVGVDLAVSPDLFAFCVELPDHAIAVAQPTAGFAVLDPAAQTPMGLGREIFEEQGVHRALEADMQFADLALGQGNDRHPSEFQVLEQGGDVCLVARDAIQRLGQYDIEPSGLGILQ